MQSVCVCVCEMDMVFILSDKRLRVFYFQYKDYLLIKVSLISSLIPNYFDNIAYKSNYISLFKISVCVSSFVLLLLLLCMLVF